MKEFLRRIWAGWKRVAHAIGVFQTKVILTIVYFVVVGFVSLVTKLARSDLIDKRLKPKPSYWHPRQSVEIDLESCKRQF